MKSQVIINGWKAASQSWIVICQTNEIYAVTHKSL